MRSRLASLIVLVLASCSITGSPTAGANDQDDIFWDVLDNYGYAEKAVADWGSKRNAIRVGKKACEMMDDGYAYNQVNMLLIQANPGTDMTLIGQTVFAGVTAYCYEYAY